MLFKRSLNKLRIQPAPADNMAEKTIYRPNLKGFFSAKNVIGNVLQIEKTRT
jgi:hypothetical protein